VQQPPSHPPPELTALLQDELLRDERVLWQGQPDPSKHFAPGDAFLVPFSLLWGGFAIVAPFAGATTEGGEPFFFIVAIPFSLFGLYFVVGRFVYKAWKKRRTLYAVTDARVVSIERGLRGPRFQAAFIDRVPAINRRTRHDGSGSVKFGNASFWTGWVENTGMEFMGWGFGGVDAPTFFDIPDANGVARLVGDLRRR
jgi:hypothetical protein